MSRNRRQSGDMVESLHALERFWQVRLPRSFHNLYTQFPQPFLAPCEFFSLENLLRGAGRGFGMIPQFLPFGRMVGESGLYGFYLTSESDSGRWPILYWEDDEMFLRPVSSDFDAFLRYCVCMGRYEMEDMDAEMLEAPEQELRREFAHLLGLSPNLLTKPIPRNNAELFRLLKELDPQDAVSLCHIGCVRRAQGNPERALDYYHRALEAAPWFGDSHYLIADIYRERENYARAVQNWWGVVQCLLPMTTRTWEWDLGEEHPEADIYEVAADGLVQYAAQVDPHIKTNPLWHAVVHADPYNPDVREALGNRLLAQNDFAGAEREYLTALALCFAETDSQPVRLYEMLTALYERTGRQRDAALTRFDCRLPRPQLI